MGLTNGTKYQGLFEKDEWYGQGKFFWKDKASWEGFWRGRKPHGIGTFTSSGGEERTTTGPDLAQQLASKVPDLPPADGE